MKLDTVKPKYKKPFAIKYSSGPIPGCVYRGDTGNSNWVSGILIQVDGDEAVLVDARDIKHTVILSTLRSLQATR